MKRHTVRDKLRLCQNFLQKLRFLADEVGGLEGRDSIERGWPESLSLGGFYCSDSHYRQDWASLVGEKDPRMRVFPFQAPSFPPQPGPAPRSVVHQAQGPFILKLSFPPPPLVPSASTAAPAQHSRCVHLDDEQQQACRLCPGALQRPSFLHCGGGTGQGLRQSQDPLPQGAAGAWGLGVVVRCVLVEPPLTLASLREGGRTLN